jgi:hypothetical protein
VLERLFASAATIIFLSCGDPSEVTLELTLIDRDTEQPIPHALVSIEVGGIYVENADTSKGPPAYQFGGRADEQGKLSVRVPDDDLGFHVFAAGYRYRPYATEPGAKTSHTIRVSPQLPEDVPPTVTEARVEPDVVEAGGSFRMIATVAAADPVADPLSDETLAILEGADFSVALDPPSAGVQGVGFPDGVYQKTLTAPEEPGTYVYHLVATTEHCITSIPVSVSLTVQ